MGISHAVPAIDRIDSPLFFLLALTMLTLLFCYFVECITLHRVVVGVVSV